VEGTCDTPATGQTTVKVTEFQDFNQVWGDPINTANMQALVAEVRGWVWLGGWVGRWLDGWVAGWLGWWMAGWVAGLLGGWGHPPRCPTGAAACPVELLHPMLPLSRCRCHPCQEPQAPRVLAALPALQGPVVVGVEGSSLQDYGSGVISSAQCGTDLDHALLIYGYNTAEGVWLAKNSWGVDWGEQGYARFAMEDTQMGVSEQGKGCVRGKG